MCLISTVTSETGTASQQRRLHTHELMYSVHVARSSWNADAMALAANVSIDHATVSPLADQQNGLPPPSTLPGFSS